MELLSPMPSNNIRKYGRSQSAFNIQDSHNIIWDAEMQGVNKKLMRLAVDSRSKRQSLMYDESLPRSRSSTLLLRDDQNTGSLRNLKITQLDDFDDARFPRMEAMSHFHYNNVDFGAPINVALVDGDLSELVSGEGLLVQISVQTVSWVVKRSIEDFIGLDRQIHRCLYDRRYSLLPVLHESDSEKLSEDMVQKLHGYLSRFSKLAGNNVNCGPILNWLELDNHGNHLVVMEADDSAINVPAIAAGCVIKRYQAQAADEITLDVGEFLSIIDMPPSEETIWWRGKKGFEVGFFPSHCVEILGGKDVADKVIGSLQSRPVSKRRGKFITFLRFFFKSRPSKDELMQHGILRERVFGCDLGERLALVGRDIPLVLEMCSAVIEEHGIVDGIYRLSGILSNLQRLRVAFDDDDEPPDLRDTRYLHDIHCISSLLKTYFRELPNPLFTYELYDKFVAAINKEDDTEKIVAFHHVIQRLPPPHYRTMKALLKHLNFCAASAKITNMTTKNLAIVWAPNLLRPNIDDSVAALTEFRTQAIIVEYMIRNVEVFFNSNLASAAIAYYPEVEIADARTASMNMGPKLITLEEAQQRLHRAGSECSFNECHSNSNSPCQKLRTVASPPTVAASPVSPLPTLLSLEEAQARKRVHLNIMRRGSADIAEMRHSTSSVDSPKRNKKWFGLFSKSKSNHEDDVIKNTENGVYRKIRTSRRHLVISSPARSRSEIGLEKLPNDYSAIHSRSRSETVSAESKYESASVDTQLPADEDLDMRMSSDGDDMSLMSAIASISAKYTAERNQLKANHRRSVTIGEPSELRRLSYHSSRNFSTNYENPTNISMGSFGSDRKLLQSDSNTASDSSVHKPIIASEMGDVVSSKDSEQPQRTFKHLDASVHSNVPAKRSRTFSPENYENPSIRNPIDIAPDSNTTGNVPSTAKSEKLFTVTDIAKGSTANKQLSPNYSLSNEKHRSVYPSVELKHSSPADESQSNEPPKDIKGTTANTGIAFQLCSAPTVKTRPVDHHAVSSNTFEVSSNPPDTFTLVADPLTHASLDSRSTKDNPELFGEISEPQHHRGISEKSAKNSPINELPDYREMEASQVSEIKSSQRSTLNPDMPKSGTAVPIPQRDYLDPVCENHSSTLNVLVNSTMARLKPDFNVDPSARSKSFVHKCGYSTANNGMYKTSSVELVNELDSTPRAKCKSCNFDANINSKSDVHCENDLRSFPKDSLKSSSAPLELHKVTIKSAPNLYTRTDYSAKPPVAPRPDNRIISRNCDHPTSRRRSTLSNARIKSVESLRCEDDSSKESKRTHRLSLNLSRRNENNERMGKRLSGELLADNKHSRINQSSPSTDKLVASSLMRKDLTKSEKPRPLSEVQSTQKKSSRLSVCSAELNGFEVTNSTTSLSTSQSQYPFLSLLNKSLSDNYLPDDGNGTRIGKFPLTLKSGSNINSLTTQNRNSLQKKRDSRPLSMYDNFRQSCYDNVCPIPTAAQYELV